jgi:RNA polymerase sigma-70 factor (ECF subfamily)
VKAVERSLSVEKETMVGYLTEPQPIVRKLEPPADKQAAYTKLYKAYHARVVRLSRLLLSDPDEAEDVGQDVLLKLFNEYATRNSAIAWEPWLMRVTVNACRDRMRSAWWKWFRSPREEFHETNQPHHWQTPEELVLSREERWRIWRSLRELSSRQREVFVLRHVEGWSTQEVADTLRLTQGSVKRHLFRAVCHLRKTLGDGA